MNAVDIAIILFVILSLTRGYRIGFVRQLGSTVGFIAGLFLGSWISSLIMGHEASEVSRSITSLLLVLIGGFALMTAGEIASVRLKLHLSRVQPLQIFDQVLGSVMSVVTLLFAVWLGAYILVLGPNSGLQQALKNSRILSTLNTELPPATVLLRSLNNLIDPNGFPEVFSGREPNPNRSANLPSLGSFDGVIADTQASIVKVEGTGCGGIVEGTGFVIASDRVATNAHVVAGVPSPKIIDDAGIHDTRVVWFDPDLDLAVLEASDLAGKPLHITSTEQPSDTPAIVAGYPGGGDFNVQPAAVIDHFMAYGRNIYGQGNTVRDIYSLNARVIPGNSGGPVIGADGQVIGIVFATSTTYNNVGYALTGQQVAGKLASAAQSMDTVGTGSCSE